MEINLEWDAAAQAAPQAFRDAVTAAANIIDATFTNPITVNIDVGYGDVSLNGQVQSTVTNTVSEGGPAGGDSYSYARLRTPRPPTSRWMAARRTWPRAARPGAPWATSTDYFAV